MGHKGFKGGPLKSGAIFGIVEGNERFAQPFRETAGKAKKTKGSKSGKKPGKKS